MRNCNCQLSEIVVVVVSLVRKKYRNVESEAFVKHLCVYSKNRIVLLVS